MVPENFVYLRYGYENDDDYDTTDMTGEQLLCLNSKVDILNGLIS